MTTTSLSFRADAAASGLPNITVDSKPNPGTVLLLSHDPHLSQPPSVDGDLSADMAFRLLDDADGPFPADVVTCDHFCPDSLVALVALLDPHQAVPHRELLLDLARAGDFSIYEDRRAARAAMALRVLIDRQRSPLAPLLIGLDADQATEALMSALLPILTDVTTDNARFKELWRHEDQHLTISEQILDDPAVEVIEHPDDQLSVVVIPSGLSTELETQPPGPGGQPVLHPMAINNRTDGYRQLIVDGPRYLYIDRSESYYRLRRDGVPNRIDLRRVAADLNFLDTDPVWQATPPSTRVAHLTTTGNSTLDAARVTTLVLGQLRSAPVAWHPFETEPESPQSHFGAN